MKGILFVVAAGAVALVGCSSSSSKGSSGDGSCNATTVFSEGAAAGDSCASCLESSCGSQVSGYQSGCSAYISCICSAAGNASAAANCESDIEQSSCESAAEALGTCVNASCKTQCNSGDAG